MLHLDQADDAPHLSSRERQILERIALGRSAKEVALELGIAHRTVERHVENARNKMRARNKTHMIAKALMCGELALSPQTPDNDQGAQHSHEFLLAEGKNAAKIATKPVL